MAPSSDCRRCVEIRARDPRERDPSRLRAAYSEEYAYVESRRQLLSPVQQDETMPKRCVDQDRPGGNNPPPQLIGLALSGGGIRSASVSLGVLQALNDAKVFSQIDYVSAVSGGGYTAGWTQAHLGAQRLPTLDRYHYEVGAAAADSLFANHGDHVEHLRTHTGFLNRGGWWGETLSLVGQWLVRWPFHVVMDDVLHWRGREPWYHVLPIYEDRIEGTYFRGNPERRRSIHSVADVQLTDINGGERSDRTPYLILNGNLTNTGASQIGVKPMFKKSWNFEFTRDFVGSDGTGYLGSRGFGLSVDRVYRAPATDASACRGDTASAGCAERPLVAVLEDDAPDTSPFPLSRAVAASGAAFDSQTVAGRFIEWPVVREVAQGIGGGLLNLHLGLDTDNFARQYDGAATIWDYTRMATYQRLPALVDTGARWLYVTDGGFYENLGVLSLLRRGVSCIISVDATADAARGYEDLITLRQRVESDLNLTWLSSLPATGSDLSSVSRFEIGDENRNLRAVVLYLKSSADPEQGHLLNIDRFVEHARRAYAVVATNLLHDLGATVSRTEEKGLRAAIAEFFARVERTAGEQKQAAKQDRDTAKKLRSALEDRAAEMVSVQASRYAPPKTSLSAQPPPVPGGPAAAAVDGSTAAVDFEGKAAELASSVEDLKSKLASQAGAPAAGPSPAPEGEARSIPTPLSEVEEQIRAIDEIASDLARKDADAECAVGRFNESRRRIQARVAEYLANPEGTGRSKEDRKAMIDRVDAFAILDRDFPHDSTLDQDYEWERFEAYRMLGYRAAITYLDELFPGHSPDDLSWCSFALPDSTTRSLSDLPSSGDTALGGTPP